MHVNTKLGTSILQISPKDKESVNTEHFHILQAGSDVWNQWRAAHPDLKPDLRGVKLADEGFSQTNLAAADLRGCSMSGANLCGLDLNGVRLAGANLDGANLSGAQLNSANLRGASLQGSHLIGTSLNSADLSWANLSHATLTKAKLVRSNLISTDCTDADLSGADLSGTSLTLGTNLTGVNFRDAILKRAGLTKVVLKKVCLIGANLQGADLSHAHLVRLDLSCANLSGANLTGANLTGANLSSVSLIDAVLRRVILTGATLMGADFRKTDLRSAALTQTNCRYANLTGADLTGLDLTQVNLSQACLEVANLAQTRAVSTNFSGAKMTGACLENWQIAATTLLDDVTCAYVYLQTQSRERRPSRGHFAPGGLANLLQQSVNTVDLVFANGLDWHAFNLAFQDLATDLAQAKAPQADDADRSESKPCAGETFAPSNQDADPLTLQALEQKRGGAFVIRIEVPADRNPDLIAQRAKAYYEAHLPQLDQAIELVPDACKDDLAAQRQYNTDLLAIVEHQAARDRARYHCHQATHLPAQAAYSDANRPASS